MKDLGEIFLNILKIFFIELKFIILYCIYQITPGYRITPGHLICIENLILRIIAFGDFANYQKLKLI